MQVTRRKALAVLASSAGATGLGAWHGLGATTPRAQQVDILGAEAELLSGTRTTDLISTRPDGPPDVLRMRQGVPSLMRVTNHTPDYTAMHWHGLRVDNAMDGVPYLTQYPIGQGESFDYHLTSPDAGTFWYHPHCMTMDQMARGLTGVLIVEETSPPPVDVDIALNLRDFRIGGDGQFIDLWTARGAARSGTKGTLVTANWDADWQSDAPAGGLVRLRLAATDTARIYRIYLPEAEGYVIALDGHPLPALRPLPTRDSPLVLSPGQRADVILRMPESEGQKVQVMADLPGIARAVASLRATGTSLNRDLREITILPPNPVSVPELAAARLEEFVFGWSPEGNLPNNGLCGTLGYTFWSINRQPWPGDASDQAGPLATLRQGESIVLRLRNESPNAHPIHLHGLVFLEIASNKKPVSGHWSDTALLLKDETLDIALVADNPGDWAFHCHVIEHQKTGLAGFIRVA